MPFAKLVSKYRTYLMGAAIIAIMFFHNLWLRDVSWLKPINYFGDFGVDIFIFVSGFGLVYSLQKNSLKQFFTNRFKRIIPLCVIGGFLKVLIDKFFIGDDSLWGWQMLIGFDLWYIKAILVLYLFAPLFYKYLNKYTVPILIGSYFLAFIGIYAFSNMTIRLTLSRVPVFIIGMLLGKDKIKISSIMLIISAIFFILAVIHRVSLIEEWNVVSNYYESAILLSFGVPFLVWSLIKLYTIFKILGFIPLLEFSGRHSLELYLVHQFVYYTIIPKSFTSDSAAMLFVAGILFSYAFAYIIFLIKKPFLDHKI